MVPDQHGAPLKTLYRGYIGIIGVILGLYKDYGGYIGVTLGVYRAFIGIISGLGLGLGFGVQGCKLRSPPNNEDFLTIRWSYMGGIMEGVTSNGL